MPEGRVVFLELKSEKGELRKEQRELANQFRYLGHEIHKVKSWKQFKEIVEGKKCYTD